MGNDEVPDRARESSAASGRSGPSPTLIILGIVGVLATVFFMQNGESTSIDFLVFESQTTIRWSILMAFAFGIVIDRLFSIWWRRRGRRTEQ
jgi:uncharacterized integral membrane protein